MTSPTIIQQPGAIDQAAAAFVQSFAIGNQIARQRKQLEIERQRAESEINLQGAQAGEAKSRAKSLDAQTEDLQAQEQGHALASGTATFLWDEHRIAQHLDGQDPIAVGYARTYIDQMRKAQADVAQSNAAAQSSLAAAGEAAQRTRDLQADQYRRTKIGNIIGSATDQQLASPTGLLSLARRIAAVDPTRVGTIMEGLEPKGNYSFFHGPDGQVYVGDQKRGTVTRTEYNVGTPPSSATLEGKKMAAAAFADAVTKLHQIRVRYGADMTGEPTAAALAEGFGGANIAGFRFGGLSGPAAWRLRKQVQQETQALNSQLIHSFATMMGGYRSIALMKSMGIAYTGQAGQATKTLEELDDTRMSMLPMGAAMAQGQPLNITQMPNYRLWVKDYMEAQHTGGDDQQTGEPDDSTFNLFQDRPPQ